MAPTDVRWVFSGVCAATWAFCSFINARRAYEDHVLGEAPEAYIPLVGGLLGVASILVVPLGGVYQRLILIPLPVILDYGSLPLTVLLFSLAPLRWLETGFTKNSDVDARNRRSETPLHVAARWNLAEQCRELLKRGADCHAMDKWGLTPLQKAEIHKALDAQEVLREVDEARGST